MSLCPEKLSTSEAHALAGSLGLMDSEYRAIETALERAPTRTELAVFAGMWSEHCAYKSTRQWLKDLPSKSDRTLAGPGSHAGTVKVDDTWAVSFKVESHNHPSAVEPYQGAATGVGGILRDIIAQGARPCAIMDSLCFGPPDGRRARSLRDGVVDGIAGYGNAFGVPNLGGRTVYDPRYEGNPLVNALAAGLVRHDGMRTAQAAGIGNAVLYVGARTGKDGILGAAFASEELSEDTAEDRPHVQVGDPFTGKKLMEACLSFMPEMGLVACQDMGASGISCAAFEMAEAGGVGIEIDLETVPLREEGMAPQEIMLSESQERFMFVVKQGHEAKAIDHFHRYGVEAVVCGRVTDDRRVRVQYRGQTVVDLPAALIADGAPLANWPLAEALPEPKPYPPFEAEPDLGQSLEALLREPSLGDKVQKVTSHYDQSVGNRTVRAPGQSEAGVLKLPDSEKGFALSLSNRGDLCAVDPYLGTMASIAETARDLACAGAELVAVTDGLNVASPRDPVENLRIKEVIRGLKDALLQLEIPVTGGNCSLYNESPQGPIPPTPMIGALGLVEDVRLIPGTQSKEGDAIFLLGTLRDQPTVSHYGRIRSQSFGGLPPLVDLAAERSLMQLIVGQAKLGRIRSAKDAAGGGLGVALAKLALRCGSGLRISLPQTDKRLDWLLFGEYPAQAWAVVAADQAESFAKAAKQEGVPCYQTGRMGGMELHIEGCLTRELEQLRCAFEEVC